MSSRWRRNLIDRERGTRHSLRFPVASSPLAMSSGSASTSATTQCSRRLSRSDRVTEKLALISRDYTRTAVLDLASGMVIAEETQDASPGAGFCPVGFYVPDWWDVNDGSRLPGSEHWCADDEWPIGDFGFVWGCYWGDDSSWKVQYLDLTRVQQGVISRDARFGYVELATFGFKSPCLTRDPEALRRAIHRTSSACRETAASARLRLQSNWHSILSRANRKNGSG